MNQPAIMVPVYRGGEEFAPCLASIRECINHFSRVFISCNGPDAQEDLGRARGELEGHEDQVVFLQTNRTLTFIEHFQFYTREMSSRGIEKDTWVLMLQHDDWLNAPQVHAMAEGTAGWELLPKSLYLGPWQVYWEPTVEAAGGIQYVDPEVISALYDLHRPSMDAGDWIARELNEPYYINTTGAIAQFQHWRAIAEFRPTKPGGMRFEMTLGSSRGIDTIRQFTQPLVGVMARPDSERERYSGLAKRKDDAHFVYWATRNWSRSPGKAAPTLRLLPHIAARSIRRLTTGGTPAN